MADWDLRFLFTKRTKTKAGASLHICLWLIRPEFLYKLIYGNFFSDLGSGEQKKKKKKKVLKMTSQLVIFRAFFFLFFLIFSIFLISPEIVKLVIGKPTVCIKSLNISSFS